MRIPLLLCAIASNLDLGSCVDTLLQLNEGEICVKHQESHSRHVCRHHENCWAAQKSIDQRNALRLCSFVGLEPIVCCPPNENPVDNTDSILTTPIKTTQSHTASKMCHEYSQLFRNYDRKQLNFDDDADNGDGANIVGGTKAKPKEFPHMAAIGFGISFKMVYWMCGGSLISNRWILTAAHCDHFTPLGVARWVLLGDLSYALTTDAASPNTYNIAQRILHPEFKRQKSYYNDIALFGLDRDVTFSENILPICLNTDPSIVVYEVVATGWGLKSDGGPLSEDLLKVNLHTICTNVCNKTYYSIVSKLQFGILDESQMCAVNDEDGKDTCQGDSGGPLQISNPFLDYGMYLQLGVTAQGQACGDHNAPGIYTKVSKFIPWIEKIKTEYLTFVHEYSVQKYSKLFSSLCNLCSMFNCYYITGVSLLYYFVQLFTVSECCANSTQYLQEGDVCQESEKGHYVCRTFRDCVSVMESAQVVTVIFLQLCTFVERQPIVCCPAGPKSNTIQIKQSTNSFALKLHISATMCRQYSELTRSLKRKLNNPRKRSFTIPNVVGGTAAEPKEFPHMALIGYGPSIETRKWSCSGSLISNKWILTAAHCDHLGDSEFARWVLLGDLNVESNTDDAKPADFEIVQRVLHPDYRPPSDYDDIALFRLDRIVEFSEYIRPACLNFNQSLNPQTQIATGWAQIDRGNTINPHLIKINLTLVPEADCNQSYGVSETLSRGILSDKQICYNYDENEVNTCLGDTGGPLQIKNTLYGNMYTQIGITSFGKYCTESETPSVHTRISNYIKWIEQIVWP
ncbi:uncharacterized protein LOC126833845 [Adelges cooleyi]|uniref:uncharacterized protein LOC126833845 n=1 Tax=Adelges cooleyi TaxID=133065 RepID=UPI00217FF2D3|nr:uncharacterized protein LOC126833845 [Adelges cooleyi]